MCKIEANDMKTVPFGKFSYLLSAFVRLPAAEEALDESPELESLPAADSPLLDFRLVSSKHCLYLVICKNGKKGFHLTIQIRSMAIGR